jgi:hypothetical protein
MKNLRESYKLYKNTSENPTDFKTYLELAALYLKFLIEKVLAGKEVTLPSRMGTLSIVGRKQNFRFDEQGKIIGLPPDWVKTKKLWDKNPEAKEKKILVYHTNDHTDNVRYKFVWTKKSVLVENKTLYSLKMTRTNKRAVHENIIDNVPYKTLG